ncbi:bifunctional GDP-fucose synthetase: GDP-4-dehydro-6-deoxy-D-mannose epimerase and GDP-4-dehydro-6-L-deoxygalactose reductase [Magnetospirillum sp. LM-5]|uniref:GDP-L-fucose synthase family protein n=1 Tax=Magnetospirillum sp. LM-5 TaxID=2681466 RepID=UPI001382B6DD|nr:GDP-L-fucose synthase [Magnetospirillum sp. LM-5]CAA7622656.1 bifunctional GDP-fucose synthetase: GDP-4-dehydro-6-deoxy-D-mannose epimerase and GDP-4-dehydro-6-L-deoxygalactose reductase [Magnetospirillum sp. LM-5]
MTFELAGKRVWVAGHKGMVGQALVRRLAAVDCQILTVDKASLDLRRQAEVEAWMEANRPDAVFIAAARVGGIQANAARPGEFFFDNSAIATNIIHGAHLTGVAKLMFLGSACVFPRICEQPIPETAMMTGPLEPTNEGYAMAKLGAIAMAKGYRRQYGRDFISVVPTNLYGPGDNLDPAASHVVPATLRKVLEAQAARAPVVVWGTGSPRREFLHVDDAADAMVFLMERYSDDDIINIGAGEDVSIRELTEKVCAIAGYDSELQFDLTKPDGMPRKQLDAGRLLAMGWRPRIALSDGLRETLEWVRGVLP